MIMLFKRKPTINDLISSLDKEMRPINWQAITIGLFFGSLLIEAAMWQFDEIKSGVKSVFIFVILSLMWCIISIPKKKSKEKQPRIYPFVSVVLGKNDKCPICGSFSKDRTENNQHQYGIISTAVACKDAECKVMDPHLHAHCTTCRTTFPTHTYDKRPIKPLDERIAAHQRILRRLEQEKEATTKKKT